MSSSSMQQQQQQYTIYKKTLKCEVSGAHLRVFRISLLGAYNTLFGEVEELTHQVSCHILL